ncbi:IS3 family transposase [Vibrio fluvialis]|nr:IS3 family transposase [Vibrio fluvialis]
MDIFEYIEMFYNVKRRHSSNNQYSPVEHKNKHEKYQKHG